MTDKKSKDPISSFQNNDCNFFERCVPNRDCQPGSMDCRLYTCVPERGINFFHDLQNISPVNHYNSKYIMYTLIELLMYPSACEWEGGLKLPNFLRPGDHWTILWPTLSMNTTVYAYLIYCGVPGSPCHS